MIKKGWERRLGFSERLMVVSLSWMFAAISVIAYVSKDYVYAAVWMGLCLLVYGSLKYVEKIQDDLDRGK